MNCIYENMVASSEQHNKGAVKQHYLTSSSCGGSTLAVASPLMSPIQPGGGGAHNNMMATAQLGPQPNQQTTAAANGMSWSSSSSDSIKHTDVLTVSIRRHKRPGLIARCSRSINSRAVRDRLPGACDTSTCFRFALVCEGSTHTCDKLRWTQ